MSFADSFRDFCPDVIVWEHVASRDAYQKPSYAAPQTFANGRREFKQVRKPSTAPGSAGIEFVQGSEIVVLGDLAIDYDDRVYVQGEAAPFPPILSYERNKDETGVVQYTLVTLGSARG